MNIASVVALIPQKGAMLAYGVAKAAQDKMTKDLAFEFAPKGVRVNSVLPGDLRKVPGLQCGVRKSCNLACTLQCVA